MGKKINNQWKKYTEGKKYRQWKKQWGKKILKRIDIAEKQIETVKKEQWIKYIVGKEIERVQKKQRKCKKYIVK